jgi:glutamyl-tRNA reductase
MIDLSVPRNIAADVNELEGVYRFDIDDLSQVAEAGKEKRQLAAASAERIVMEEVRACWEVLEGEVVARGIKQLTQHAEELRVAELAKNEALLAKLEPKDRESIEAMTRALLKKLLHEPLGYVRKSAAEGRGDRVEEIVQALIGPTKREDQ